MLRSSVAALALVFALAPAAHAQLTQYSDQTVSEKIVSCLDPIRTEVEAFNDCTYVIESRRAVPELTASALMARAKIQQKRGNAAQVMTDINASIDNYGRAASLPPDKMRATYSKPVHASALKWRSELLFAAGNKDGAAADLAKAIELDPGNLDYLIDRVQMREADKDWAGAVADYDAIVKIDATNAAAFFQRGMANVQLKNYPAAVTDFGEAAKLKPDMATAHFSRGYYSMLTDKQSFERSIGDYETAVKLEERLKAQAAVPIAEAYFLRGNKRFTANDSAGAVADYSETIRMLPNLPDAWANRGTAQFKLGKYAEAVADYTKTLELKPDHANAAKNKPLAEAKLKAQ